MDTFGNNPSKYKTGASHINTSPNGPPPSTLTPPNQNANKRPFSQISNNNNNSNITPANKMPRLQPQTTNMQNFPQNFNNPNNIAYQYRQYSTPQTQPQTQNSMPMQAPMTAPITMSAHASYTSQHQPNSRYSPVIPQPTQESKIGYQNMQNNYKPPTISPNNYVNHNPKTNLPSGARISAFQQPMHGPLPNNNPYLTPSINNPYASMSSGIPFQSQFMKSPFNNTMIGDDKNMMNNGANMTSPKKVEMKQFGDGQLPPTLKQLLDKAIMENSNNNYNSQSIMFEVGSCEGYLFGHIQHQHLAETGTEAVLSYGIEEETNNPVIKCVAKSSAQYLGQADRKIVSFFSKYLKSSRIKLSSNIIAADLEKLKRQLPLTRYMRKLSVNVQGDCQTIYQIACECKNIVNEKQAIIWNSKSTLFRYFLGEVVDFEDLKSAFKVASISQSYIYDQLESNFNLMFDGLVHAEDLEGIDPDTDIITTKLLQHQRTALEWMKLRENHDEDELPPFYTEEEDKETGDIYYLNALSKERCNELPEIGSGGILADDMGLGKTLQMIALIASNSEFDSNGHTEEPTLIVAPLTVIGNWVQQFEDHVKKDSFRILIYHGSNRERDLEIIKNHDIVITTYDILTLEYSEEDENNREEMREHYGCGLQYINWARIILDEAHKIRSRKTRVFKACNALVARSRWCLSGTPVQNKLDDLFSLFAFLKLQPICEKTFWNKFILQPLKSNNHIGFDRLRTIMKQVCLRRSKDMEINGRKIIEIPDKQVETRYLDFNDKEYAIYQKLRESHRQRFMQIQEKGDQNVMKHFSTVLSLLLRLRQCCDHVLLVPNEESKETNEDSERLEDIEDSSEECASCGMPPDNAILTTCYHIYCRDCFENEIDNNSESFPCRLCGENLNRSNIKEERNKTDANDGNEINPNNTKNKKNKKNKQNDDNDENNDNDDIVNNNPKRKKWKKFQLPTNGTIIEPSTKIQALIDDIKKFSKYEVAGMPNKAVVFSQWTSMLDIIGYCFDKENIQYERLDGTMSRAARDAAMDAFRTNREISVFLMSLKAGNLGVNMVVANIVYMLDPWWNPSTEDQAVDRVHRLGQKREVHIVHFIQKNSVEEKIVEIQKRKRKLIKSALGKTKEVNQEERKQEWLQDLKALFQ